VIPARIVNALAGKPVIRFGGDTQMTLPRSDALGLLESDYEIFVVARSDSAGLQFLIGDDRSYREQHALSINGTAGAGFIPNAGATVMEDDSADLGAAEAYCDGQPHLFDARVQQGVGYLKVDGVESNDVVGAAVGFADTGLLLGSSGDLSTAFEGDIAEVAIYSPALNAGQRAEVEQYLADRWNVSLAPEPSTLVLLLAAGLLFGMRKRPFSF